MGLPWCEYWSRLSIPPPGDLPNPGNRTCISWVSCTAGRLFTSEPPGKTKSLYRIFISTMFLWCFGVLFCLFSWWLVVSTLTNEKVKVTQSWPTLCNPIDGSLSRSSLQVILQARILEWVDFSFSTWEVPKDIYSIHQPEPRSPALQVDSLPSELPGKHFINSYMIFPNIYSLV